MPLGTAHLRSDEGPPPEALLTSRRARSGEGSAPRAPGDHGKDTGKVRSREEGKFYSAEDADRATSTNYLYQEPDCRVERLPDALASTLPGGG